MSITNRYIAMCDILGFSNLIYRESTDEVRYKYEGLKTGINAFTLTERVIVNNTPLVCTFEKTIFSDTLLTWVDEHQGKVAHQLFFASLCKLIAISLGMRLPMRLGIAYGECCIDKTSQTYIGKPIVDAYLTEQSQNWIGGAFHKSCLNGPDFKMYCNNIDFFVPYNIPLKDSAKTVPCSFGLNWVNNLTKEDYNWLLETERLNQIPEVWIKYKNTLDFCNAVPKGYKHFL